MMTGIVGSGGLSGGDSSGLMSIDPKTPKSPKARSAAASDAVENMSPSLKSNDFRSKPSGNSPMPARRIFPNFARGPSSRVNVTSAA